MPEFPTHYDTINRENIDRQDRPDMSIAVGLIGTDGIVLATDSKTVEGKYAYNNTQKLWQLTESVGLMSTGGFSQARHFTVELLRQDKAKYLHDTSDLMNTSLQVADFLRTMAKKSGFDLPQLGINEQMQYVLAGYDLQKIPRLISMESIYLASFAPSEHYPFYFSGVKDIGIYWTKRLSLVNYKLPCEFLKKFAVMVIKETIVYSDVCDKPIQMAVVDKAGYHSIAILDRNGYYDINDEVRHIEELLDSDFRQQWLYDYLDKFNKSH